MISDEDQERLQKVRIQLECKYADRFVNQLSNEKFHFELMVEIRQAQGNIPLKFRNQTLEAIDHPQLQRVKGYVQDYIDNIVQYRQEGKAPVFYGSNGLGKSLMASIVLIEAIKKNYTVLFTDVDGCVASRNSGFGDEDNREEFEHNFLTVDFLLIDELGSELKSTKSNNVASTLTKILKARVHNFRPTIITTNLSSIAEIKSYYDNTIYSTALEQSIPIECTGVDYRKHVIALKIKKDINPD